MNLFSNETQKIVNSNYVTAKTYDAKVKSVGFANYVKSLGGIFTKLYGNNTQIVTEQDLHERMEFVVGLMTIFRFCYWNGTTWWFWLNSAAKSFYSSKITNKGCSGGTIYQLCQGTDGRLRITCCNYGIDTLLKACGIYSLTKTTVTSKSKLVPGDVIDLYRKSDGKWHHQVMVHSISDGKIWCVDFGNRFIKTGKPLHYMSLSGNTAGGEYGDDSWKGRHRITLKKEEPKVKTDIDKAVELTRAIRNFLNVKKKEYGDGVYNMAQNYLIDRDAYLRACADYVLNGYAGSGDARKAFFGEDYDAVQEKVNWVIHTAKEVLDGKYGSGEARKELLGADYYVVQAEVNRLLKG